MKRWWLKNWLSTGIVYNKNNIVFTKVSFTVALRMTSVRGINRRNFTTPTKWLSRLRVGIVMRRSGKLVRIPGQGLQKVQSAIA